MFCMLKKPQMHPTYVLKYNSNRDKQVIILIILNREGWHYLETRKFISIIKRKNIQTPRRFLLPELPSFFCNEKQT